MIMYFIAPLKRLDTIWCESVAAGHLKLISSGHLTYRAVATLIRNKKNK